MSKIFLSFLVFFALIPSNAVAQITPDSSLGTENSVVNSNGHRDTIQGGAVRNTNLFHSFTEFNVGAGREAYFANPNGIANIFSRVTGNNFSNIQGVLGVLGNANLYLINPNGILFGQNARLDVNGSFFATTADSVVFGNGIEFSATNPNQPPLLTIDIPIGLRFRDNPAPIINISVANDVGLQVKPEETLGLIGGNVVIGFPDPALDGKIIAPGSNIELGGLLATGIVTIGDDFKLSFPEAINKADVFLLNGAEVNVASDGGGAITINAKDITLIGGSQLVGGIAESLGNTNSQAGDITLNATENVVLNDGRISTSTQGRGDAGDVIITTSSLTLGDGVSINAGTFGEGNGGNITIDARNSVSLVSQGNVTDISSAVNPNAVGNGGDININTSLLTVTNRAYFDVSTFQGQGNAGNVILNATEAVNFDRQDTNGANGIFANVYPRSTGNGGNIEINTGSLTLDNGTRFFANNLGQGNGGNITINATETVALNLNSQRTGFFNVTAFFTDVSSGTDGNAGNIEVNTGFLTLDNGAELSAKTNSQGNAGNIIINATDNISLNNDSDISVRGSEGNAGNIDVNTGSLTLDNGSELLANTRFGQGKGGNITISAADDVSLNNDSAILISGSEGGSIDITAKNLTLMSDSILVGGIAQGLGFTAAQSGDVVINLTEDLVLDGLDKEGLTLITNSNLGTGNAGNIDIKARNITFRNGANVASFNDGQGNIGKINLTATGNITFDGIKGSRRSGVNNFVAPGGIGDVGEINITAENLTLTNGARVTSVVSGIANSGNINLNIADTININGLGLDEREDVPEEFPSSIFTNVAFTGIGNSGSINIDAQNLSLSGNGFIDTEILGQGNSGSINITANTITIDGEGNQNLRPSSISSSASSDLTDSPLAEANGGNIFIDTNSLLISNGGDITSDNNTIGKGSGGNIKINATENVSIDGTGIIFAEGNENKVSSRISASIASIDVIGNGGSVEINTPQLTLNNNSLISTSTQGQGNAGNINLNVTNSLTLTGGSAISASVTETATGNAGNTNIETQRLTLSEGSQISNITFGNGNAGNLTILATESIELIGIDLGRSGLLVNALETDGNGGDLQIFTKDLIIADGAIVTASNFPTVEGLGEPGTGKPGSISIEANSIRLENGGIIDAATQSPTGEGANITLQVPDDITLRDNSLISAQTFEEATGGNINIKARSLLLENGASLNTSTLGQGNSGIISIKTDAAVTLSGAGTALFNTVEAEGVGNSQGISIEAESLSVTDGATISASTSGIGNAGDITLKTPQLTIAQGGSISAFTDATGNGGSIIINANSFEATGGGQVITTTRGSGSAGTIKLNIAESIFISGTDPDFVASGIFANTSADSTGDGGSISIGIFQQQGETLVLAPNQFTQEVTLANGARIAADSQGEGNGGVISLQAQDLTLDNQAEILAETRAKQDNNTARSEINLTLDDILQLKNDSRISTQAFSNADGGNINIDAKFIIAFPGQNEGSDILTRAAQEGTGGDINITAEALLGIQERKATPGNKTNDIDASSEFGLSGEVSIEQPTVDPTSGLVELTQEVVDASQLIAQNVCTQTANSEFVDIGKGGLPQNPDDVLAEDMSEVGLVAPVTASEAEIESNRKTEPVKPKITTRKPPAQGWIWHEDGSVELVAYNPNQAGEQRTWDNHRRCQEENLSKESGISSKNTKAINY